MQVVVRRASRRHLIMDSILCVCSTKAGPWVSMHGDLRKRNSACTMLEAHQWLRSTAIHIHLWVCSQPACWNMLRNLYNAADAIQQLQHCSSTHLAEEVCPEGFSYKLTVHVHVGPNVHRKHCENLQGATNIFCILSIILAILQQRVYEGWHALVTSACASRSVPLPCWIRRSPCLIKAL